VVEETDTRKTVARRGEVGRGNAKHLSSASSHSPTTAGGTPDSRRVAWTAKVRGTARRVTAARRREAEEARVAATMSWSTGRKNKRRRRSPRGEGGHGGGGASLRGG
jgi:hypothetical protein